MHNASADFLQRTIAIILAAGQGKRMNSILPKVAHPLLGKPLLCWVIDSLSQAGIQRIVPVINSNQQSLHEIIQNQSSKLQITIAFQNDPLGTGDAVLHGLNSVTQFFQQSVQNETIIVVAYGDTPAIKANTFLKLLKQHTIQGNVITIIAFKTKQPHGYGRIITDENNEFLAIREHKDCNTEELNIDLCNSGFLCGNYLELSALLPTLTNKNTANEYYLTDIVLLAKQQGFQVGLMVEDEENQFLGVNTQEQLADMEKILNANSKDPLCVES